MASLMEELIDVLEQEHGYYEELLKVSMEKTPVIVSNDLNRLKEITQKEQNIVDMVNQLEKRRDEVLANIATVLNRNEAKMTVSTVIDLMKAQPDYQQKLAKIHKKIKDVAFRLKDVNQHNFDLLSTCLEMTEVSIQLLQNINQAPETANYAKGSYSGDTLGASRPMFDAKQ